MSTSTDAILAFGFDLGEELPEQLSGEEGGFDFYEWAEKRAGMSWKPGDKDYFKRRDAMLAALPVSIETHCSGDCPMYFLAWNGSTQTARRGYPTNVVLPTPSEEQINAMRRFCDENGIKWLVPAWHIFSYWG